MKYLLVALLAATSLVDAFVVLPSAKTSLCRRAMDPDDTAYVGSHTEAEVGAAEESASVEVKAALEVQHEEPKAKEMNGKPTDTAKNKKPFKQQRNKQHKKSKRAKPTEEEKQAKFDAEQMRHAIQMAHSGGGERGTSSPFPKPRAGAVIVAKDGTILGRGRSNYQQDCVRAAIADAGLDFTPLKEWCVTWPSNRQLREALAEATLYTTLEPSDKRQGEALPPITQLIQQSGIPRVVIGCPDPIPERATQGASTLHSSGIQVSMGVQQEDCVKLIEEYAELANSKLQVKARQHFERYGKPLGFLHCSVVDSDDAAAFARHGNAFGKHFGGKNLSFRDFGSYELAPPPQFVWAPDDSFENDFETEELDDMFMDFEEEDYQDMLGKSPMMPMYEQVDAVVATFPREGNGPPNDQSVTGRMNGLKWLATVGEELPANVERILVLDATDLADLPLTNDDDNLPRGVDIEAFWKGHGRKPTRVLLRRGENAAAQAAAGAAARAAEAAADYCKKAVEVIETGDAAAAAELAIECQDAAVAATTFLQKSLEKAQGLRRNLAKKGVLVETLEGGEPIDVMKYLGKRNGYDSVAWRAGCWGERGVQSILADAFQWVSAHLAVDAVGGKFWQLMLAERAVQAACGPEQKVKVLADQEDISMEYCDDEMADKDCVLTVDGRPVRHVRLDCRIALIDETRPKELVPPRTKKLMKRLAQEAPWFL